MSDYSTWLLLLLMAGLFVLFWVRRHALTHQQLVESSVALRFFVLFIVRGFLLIHQGVMNCLYSAWDICDDLILRKVNESDASAFARLVGCCPSQVWGIVWLLISFAFFVGGILYVLITYDKSRYHHF